MSTISDTSRYWQQWADNVLEGQQLPDAIALEILHSDNESLLPLLQAAYTIRRRFFGRGVWLHVIRSAKSGLCPEDCSYCSQSASASSDITTYPLETVASIVEGAREAQSRQAIRYCIVTSGRMPVEHDLEVICDAVSQIKATMPLQICTSLGMLDAAKVKRLKEAGVDRYNHNLETSAAHYGNICSTHSYEDRLRTARMVKDAGMELCSGGLLGMGESLQDRVELASSLRELDTDSVPLNFLNPRQGTQLENLQPMAAPDALRALAMFRFMLPSKELRIAGGRELILGPLQALGLYPANSIFTKGYLTTDGQGFEEDKQMIESAGFHIAEIVDA